MDNPFGIKFFFDSNQWFDIVDNSDCWSTLVSIYGLDNVLNARIAPQDEIDKLPVTYHIAVPKVHAGEMPSFGFGREHTGDLCLEDWALSKGVDLRKLKSESLKDK